MITPLATSSDETWNRLIRGQSAITGGSHGLEAPVRNFSINGTRSRMGDFAVAAAREALQHAELTTDDLQSTLVGCAVSQSKPILSGHFGSHLDPALLLSSFFGCSSERVVQNEFHLNGPSANIAAACATGVASIETGAHWLKTGQCEIALVGAAEASLHPFFRAGFEQMGVLAHGDASAARPFHKDRSGFVMGEGAAVLVLETEASAHKRGKTPMATLEAVRLRHSSCDPLRFDPDGSSIAQLIQSVLLKGTLPGYINAHGTGTKFNDESETRGIRHALGHGADRTPVSSTKAATGHLLGAAGAVEAAFAVLALRDQILPPTLNLTEPDPICDLDYIPHLARAAKISTALSLSYGFGGQMGAVLFGSC